MHPGPLLGVVAVSTLAITAAVWEWRRVKMPPDQELKALRWAALLLALAVLALGVALALVGLRLIAWMDESEGRMRAMEREMPNLIEWTHYWKGRQAVERADAKPSK